MNFIGKEIVTILPGTDGYSMSFNFLPCSAPDKNDQGIPYGTTIASAVVQVMDKDGTDITAAAVGTTTMAGGLQVNTSFNYPPQAAKGACKVYVRLTLSTAKVITKQWDGLWVG